MCMCASLEGWCALTSAGVPTNADSGIPLTELKHATRSYCLRLRCLGTVISVQAASGITALLTSDVSPLMLGKVSSVVAEYRMSMSRPPDGASSAAQPLIIPYCCLTLCTSQIICDRSPSGTRLQYSKRAVHNRSRCVQHAECGVGTVCGALVAHPAAVCD